MQSALMSKSQSEQISIRFPDIVIMHLAKNESDKCPWNYLTFLFNDWVSWIASGNVVKILSCLYTSQWPIQREVN